MSDLVIHKINSVYVQVSCERGIAQELSDFFTFKVPGYQFMPAYRNKTWDGEIKMYNMFTEQNEHPTCRIQFFCFTSRTNICHSATLTSELSN